MSRLHHIAIICSDKNASLDFYMTLGFSVVKVYPRPEREDEIIFLEGYGITLEMFIAKNRPHRPSDPEAYGLRHIALLVDSVEDVCESLKDHGYLPETIRYDSMTGEKMTFVKDPDMLPIELHE